MEDAAMDRIMRQVMKETQLLMSRDFGTVPIELGKIGRGLGADQFSDEELLAFVARHQRGDFGEYGLFEDQVLTDDNRRGDVEYLSRGQMNRVRIEMKEPHEIRSRYETDKGTLYVSSITSSYSGRITNAYGPEGL